MHATATAAETAKSGTPPTFRTDVSEYGSVDVDIEPSELEAAGWIYVGKSDGVPNSETVYDVVRAWHDREHPGPWPWCDLEPCKDLK